MPGALEVRIERFSHGEAERGIMAAGDCESRNGPEVVLFPLGEQIVVPEDFQCLVAVVGADQRLSPSLHGWMLKHMPQPERHQGHPRPFPPRGEIVGAARDQHEPGGGIPREVPAMTSDGIAVIGGGVAMTTRVIGHPPASPAVGPIQTDCAS